MQNAKAQSQPSAASCALQATELQLELHLDENEIAELQRDFEDIDHDGSGWIDAAEVAQLLTKERHGQRGWFAHPTAEEVQHTVAQYDQNRDNQITFREYVTTLCGLRFVTAASNSHDSAAAATRIQALFRSYRSRARQRTQLHRRLLVEVANASGWDDGAGQVFSYMWPRSLRTAMYLAVTAASDLFEVLHRDTAHARQAVEAVHAMQQLQSVAAGADDQHSRLLRQSACLAYNAFAANGLGSGWGHDDPAAVTVALERAEGLSEGGMFTSSRAQFELKIWNLSLQSEAAVRTGDMQRAALLTEQLIEQESMFCSPVASLEQESGLVANLGLVHAMHMMLQLPGGADSGHEAVKKVDQAQSNREGECMLPTDLLPGARLWVPKACAQAVVRHNCALAALQASDWSKAVEHAASAMQHAVTAVGMITRWGVGAQQQSGMCNSLVSRFELLLKLAVHASAAGACQALIQMPSECRIDSNRVESELANARFSLPDCGPGQPTFNVLPLWWLMCST